VLAVAIISVALSSLIALAAIGAAVWQQRRAFGHDREMADRASVRTSLVDAAAVLHRVEGAVDEASRAVFGHADTLADPSHPERLQPVRDLQETNTEFDLTIGLIRVRLGPSSGATKALEEAAEASRNVWRAARRIRLPKQGDHMVRVSDRNEALIDQVERSQADFKTAVRSFVERAHAVAGAHLEEKGPAESADPE
jgi:hypothetical protein